MGFVGQLTNTFSVPCVGEVSSLFLGSVWQFRKNRKSARLLHVFTCICFEFCKSVFFIITSVSFYLWSFLLLYL